MPQSRYDSKAFAFFDEGFNCAQSVFAAFAPSLGMEPDKALKTASCFGGGMNLGSTCGALTGALMVLGLAVGYDRYSPETKAELSTLSLDFISRWQEQIGSLDCRDILEIDPTDPLQKQAAKDAGITAQRCTNCVETAVLQTEEFLRELDIL